MTPTDPRHATVAGYRAGCRQTCCRHAINRYNQARKTAAPPPLTTHLVDPTGTRRRIRALVALGWSFPRLAPHFDMDPSYLRILARDDLQDHVTADTAAKVTAVYDRLAMTLPPATTPGERQGITRARAHAKAHGWLPPLALDDDRIDDPAYRPTRYLRPAERAELRDTDYDFAIVERVLAGEPRPRKLTHREAAEVVRRLTAAGVSGYEIEHTWGLVPQRYQTSTDNLTGETAA